MSSDSTVLGVAIYFRHGDRQGFYQSPNSYTASETNETPLGEVQEYELGQYIRSRYITDGSDYQISGLNTTAFDSDQVTISADTTGEGRVIYDSAVALTQGCWPATNASSTTLANGTTVTSPLGGYQYVPIVDVTSSDDYALEPWSDCPTYTAANTAWYNSSTFKDKAAEAAPFLQNVSSIVGNRSATFANMYNIFDFINVQYIHDASFAAQVSNTTYLQARDYANWHEYHSFSSLNLSSPLSLAGRAVFPQIFSALDSFTNASNPVVMQLTGVSYKPFIGMFNMTGAATTYPQLAGLVNYAAAIAFEVRHSTASNDYTVTMLFKNGTDDAEFVPYNMFGSSTADYPLADFVSNLAPYTVNSFGEWCNVCENNSTRGCGAFAELNATTAELAALQSAGSASTTYGNHAVSPLAAGFIGAAVTAVIAAAVLALMYLLGLAAFGKKAKRAGGAATSNYDLPAYERKNTA